MNHNAGITANRTLASLRTNDSTLNYTSRDIYNKTAQLVRESRKGMSLNEALFQEFEASKGLGKLYFDYTINTETRRIERLFLADIRFV